MPNDNNKKVRGNSYDTKLIKSLMKDGLSAKEIADKLGVTSVQSVRNAIRAINDSLEYEKIKKHDQERIKKMPVEIGIIPCAMDVEVASALESILAIFSSRDHSLPTIISGNEGKIIIIHDQPDYRGIRNNMDKLGFYGKLCSENHRVDVTKIEFPGRGLGNIDKSFLFNGIFTIESDYEERIKFEQTINPYVESNDLSFLGINDMGIADSCSVNTYASIKKKIADSGLHFHIKYDPLRFFPVEKYYLTNNNEQNLVFAPVDFMSKMDNAFQEIIFELNTQFSQEILRYYSSLHLSNVDINSLRDNYFNASFSTITERFQKKLGFMEIPYVSNGKIEIEIKNRINQYMVAYKKYLAQTQVKENADPLQELEDLQMQKTKKEVEDIIKLYIDSQKGISRQGGV